MNDDSGPEKNQEKNSAVVIKRTGMKQKNSNDGKGREVFQEEN
jgi:hypothetical protein